MSEFRKMTLDEAIEHCNDVVNDLIEKGGCMECIEEHAQLGIWLVELKELKEFKKRVMKAVNNI